MISPEEGLKSVLIVNLSRIGLSPGSVRPPPPSDRYEFRPAHLRHPSSAPEHRGSPARAYLLAQLTIASRRSTSKSSGVGLLAPRSWNLITASLTNLELIHFRWRWLITADGKSHPGRASTLLAVNEKKAWTWLLAAIPEDRGSIGSDCRESWNAFVKKTQSGQTFFLEFD